MTLGIEKLYLKTQQELLSHSIVWENFSDLPLFEQAMWTELFELAQQNVTEDNLHTRRMQRLFQNGWSYGAEFSRMRRHSPALLPFVFLPNAERICYRVLHESCTDTRFSGVSMPSL